MTTNRKISQKAAYQIADKFVRNEFADKARELNEAEDAMELELDAVMQDIASQSYAKTWHDGLSDDDRQFFQDMYRYSHHVKFVTDVTVDGDTSTQTMHISLEGWWCLSQAQLRVLCMVGHGDTAQGLDLRHTMSEAMRDHPAAIAYVKARRAYRDWCDMIHTLHHRIESDICGRKVKDVLQAWPELTDVVNEYYPQAVTTKPKPLQTPLSDVIASIQTPMITQE